MGLDQFLAATPADAYDAETDFNPIGERWEVAYWRKHNALHGWMEALYVAKGGQSQEMCAEGVNLTAEDLDALEEAVRTETLPVTTGFFFGSDSSEDPERKEYDLGVVSRARVMLARGMKVYYTSSW